MGLKERMWIRRGSNGPQCPPEEELPHGYLTDAFSYGGMSYEGGQTKENVVYHEKMPTRDKFP